MRGVVPQAQVRTAMSQTLLWKGILALLLLPAPEPAGDCTRRRSSRSASGRLSRRGRGTGAEPERASKGTPREGEGAGWLLSCVCCLTAAAVGACACRSGRVVRGKMKQLAQHRDDLYTGPHAGQELLVCWLSPSAALAVG